MKKVLFFVYFFLFLYSNSFSQDTILVENFESTQKPAGWTEIEVKGKGQDGTGGIVNWSFVTQGENNQPGSAYQGTRFAYFYYESLYQEATKLKTPAIDLVDKGKPEIRFWHCMKNWNSGGADYNDRLKVYVKTNDTTDDRDPSTWTLLASYVNPVETWIERTILIPDSLLSPTTYIAFEGITGYGHGVCIDSMVVLETEIRDRSVTDYSVNQASLDFVATGSKNNAILRIDLKVTGNTGDVTLDSLRVGSLNSNDGHISPSGVKLFYTDDNAFNTSEQIGAAVDFNSGFAVFSNINKQLLTGYNYIWVTYDIIQASDTIQNKIVDAYIPQLGIKVGDSLLPSSDISPGGQRLIYEALFYDDFDSDKGWTFPIDSMIIERWDTIINSPGDTTWIDTVFKYPNEFQIDTTCTSCSDAMRGGSDGGNPDPQFAYSGTKILGVDVTGIGTNLKDYESMLRSYQYSAVSPSINCFYFNNVNVSFKRWLNVSASYDVCGLQVSSDGGVSWSDVYKNGGPVADNSWEDMSYNVTSQVARKQDVKFRFYTGPTFSFNNNYSGWNIDDFILTGDYVSKDIGIIDWPTPISGCLHSSSDTVKVWVKNYGAEDVNDDIPLSYHFEGPLSITVYDTLHGGLAKDDSVLFVFSEPVDLSTPYFYSSSQVDVNVLLNGDEDVSNNSYSKEIIVYPTYKAPFIDDFESTSGFFRNVSNDNLWERGLPQTTYLNSAASGFNSWVTNPDGYYTFNDSSVLESPCYDLSDADFPIVTLKFNEQVEKDKDGVALYYSVDTGSTWNIVPAHSESYNWNWYNNNIEALETEGWDTTTNGWLQARQFLPANTANKPLVQFRFLFESNGGTGGEGFAFDDFGVYDAPNDLEVLRITAPDSSCELGSAEKMTMEILNHNYDALQPGDTFYLAVNVNNGAEFKVDTVVMSTTVAVGDSFLYQTNNTFDLHISGVYNIKTYAYGAVEDDIYADTNYINDTATRKIFNYKPYVNFGPDIYTVLPDTIVLDAYDTPGNDYDWMSLGDTPDSILEIDTAGMYWIKVTNPTNSCAAEDTITIHQLIFDIGIDSILTPISDCELTASEIVSVRLHNYGTDTLRAGYDLDIYFKHQSISDVQEVWDIPDTVFVYPDSSYIYTFISSVNMSAVGQYNFISFANHVYDDSTSNDSLLSTIEVYGYPNFDLQPSDTVHRGSSFVLNAKQGNTEFISFYWGDTSTDSTLLINTIGSGIYYCTVTDIYGCSSSDSSMIRLVIPDIKPDTIFSPFASCGPISNDTVIVRIKNTGSDTIVLGEKVPIKFLLDTVLEVVDTIRFTQNFYPGDSIDFAFDSLISYDSIGNYFFSIVTMLDYDSIPINDSISDSLFIYPLPNLELGPNANKPGISTYTIDAGSGFASYLWNDGSTNQTFEVNYLNYEVPHSVTVTDDRGCQKNDQVKILLSFNDVKSDSIMLSDTSCSLFQGDTIPVRIKNIGTNPITELAIMYQFKGASAFFDTVSVTLAKRGSVVYYLTANKDYMNDFDTLNLTFVSQLTKGIFDISRSNDTLMDTRVLTGAPVVDWVYVPVNDTVKVVDDWPITLSFNQSYQKYLWNNGSTKSSLTVNNNGWYQVTVTNFEGCKNRSAVFLNNSIGIDNIDFSELKIYPVPASDHLTVELPDNVKSVSKLSLVSAQGIIIDMRGSYSVVGNEVEIDILGILPGVYYVVIDSDFGSLVTSFVKK